MDIDKSGSLSLQELREVLRQQGDYEDEAALASLFGAMDADGDGTISFAEAEAHETSSQVRAGAAFPAGHRFRCTSSLSS